MKRLAVIITVILLWLPLTQQNVQAYWAEQLLSSPTAATSTIIIGEWLEDNAVYWEPNPDEDYEEGDVVYWEGEYYVRTNKAKGLNVEPGEWLSWLIWE